MMLKGGICIVTPVLRFQRCCYAKYVLLRLCLAVIADKLKETVANILSHCCDLLCPEIVDSWKVMSSKFTQNAIFTDLSAIAGYAILLFHFCHACILHAALFVQQLRNGCILSRSIWI